MTFVTFFDMLINHIFKMTTCIAHVAKTTASTSKFIYQEIFQIAKNMALLWKIIFNFE